MNDLFTTLRKACGTRRWLIVSAGVALGVFLLAPIAVIIATSFTSSTFLIFPPDLFSVRWYKSVLQSPEWQRAFFTSIQTSVGATAVAVTGGTLAALAVRRAPSAAYWLRTIFIAPLIIPVIGYAVGLYLTFALISLSGTIWSLMLGQGALALPLAFIAVSGGLANVPRSLNRAAESLGAYWPKIVWTVELPLIRPSIMVATLITLVFTFDEVVIAIFLTRPGHPTLPVQIWNSVYESVSPAIAAVGSLILGAATVLAILAALTLGRSRR